MSAQVQVNAEHARRAAFVTMVAHELRTPLTAVHGALELMAGAAGTTGGTGAGEGASPELVELARRNTSRLLRLVEDCLDLQAAHDGTLELARCPVDPAELVALAMDDVQRTRRSGPLVEQRCLATRRVDADAPRLSRAIAHLVENACSFAPAGTRVTVTATDDPARGHVRFTVEDKGVGFPAGRSADFFASFASHETAGRTRVHGLGVGLGLVRVVAEWHGGVVGASSEGGRTAFWIEVPGESGRVGSRGAERRRTLGAP